VTIDPWDDLAPELRDLVVAYVAETELGGDPAERLRAIAPEYRGEWLWHIAYPHEEVGASAAENERLVARADSETSAALAAILPPLSTTGELLEAVASILQRFIVWSFVEQVYWVALWVLHTYVFDVFDTTPYLNVSSAAKQSGKTRLVCEVLPLLVARPWVIAEPSEAVLFRKVHKDRPTLLLDEIDATFGKDLKTTEGIRAIYNLGYRRGAKVPRCVGNSHEPFDFDVFCPKAFAGLKGLPDTVRDRSGHIELRRRAPSEPKPERLRLGKLRVELQPLVERLSDWAVWAAETIQGTEPLLSDSLSDRAQDACEVLAAIADLAGGEWPERARLAFLKVMGAVEDDDRGVMLLGHCKEAFAQTTDHYLPTERLLRVLVDRGDDSPWAGWWGSDVDHEEIRKPAMRLAQLLKPYGIQSKDTRVRGSDGEQPVAKAYHRADFQDAWSRYVHARSGPSGLNATEVATSLHPSSETTSVKTVSQAKTTPDQERSDVATVCPSRWLRPEDAVLEGPDCRDGCGDKGQPETKPRRLWTASCGHQTEALYGRDDLCLDCWHLKQADEGPPEN
jgi:hypothetical protein